MQWRSNIYFFQKFCPPIDDMFRALTFYTPLSVNDVHWNFDKFMVGRDGRIVSRYDVEDQNRYSFIRLGSLLVWMLYSEGLATLQ